MRRDRRQCPDRRTLPHRGRCSHRPRRRIGDDCHIHPRAVLYPGTTLGNWVIVHAGAVLGADGFGLCPRHTPPAPTPNSPSRAHLSSRMKSRSAPTPPSTAAPSTRPASAAAQRSTTSSTSATTATSAKTSSSSRSPASPAPASVGNGAVIAGQVGIGDHATIGEQVILGSGSGVLTHKKVHGPGVVFWGRPARPLKQYLKELATLSRLAEAPTPKREAMAKPAQKKSARKKPSQKEKV